MANCRSCKAAVIWATSATTGANIPLDPHPIAGGNIELRLGRAHYVEPNGVMRRYVSHFATCPNAKQHRRGKA